MFIYLSIYKDSDYSIYMKSSYTNALDYGDIFSSLCYLKKPRSVVEIGLLHGYSLKQFADNVDKTCSIRAFDIFNDFNGNSANKEDLLKTFNRYGNVSINYGDFYKVHKTLENNSIDIIHIDIANNGDVFRFAIDNYFDKLTEMGVLILEGGSVERDNIDWMNKYNKPKINDTLLQYKDTHRILTIGSLPSLTLIQK